ncbi:MAG: glycosyltransferase family 4 protein [Lentisphaeria bacterium]|nr:glycosyltransferase family 4 protein [Lentisphaeria bacterium]
MRTAHIIRRFAFSEWGGTESVVWNTARALHEKGNPSEIFATCALSLVQDEVKNSIQIHRFKYRYPRFPLSKEKIRALDKKGGDPVVPGLQRALKKGEFDILHCHTMGRMAATVRAAAKQLHVPYVMTLHGGYFDVPPEEIRQMVKPMKGTIPYGNIIDRLLGRRVDALKFANGIVCVGANELQPAKEHFPDKLIIHLPNGVNYDIFHNYDGADFRKQVGIRADRKILLCVSRLDYQKNQLMLPEVLALLGEPWHLVFIGAPTAEWYVDKLREKIRLMNLTDRVTMINGVPPDSTLLPAAYHAASAFLLPSLHEPFGIVVLEAWSAGTPVIASPVGGLKTLIRDGETGFFAPAEGAPHEWADLIRKLDEDEDLRGRITEAADEEVREHYSWNTITDKLLDFYQEVQRIHRRR